MKQKITDEIKHFFQSQGFVIITTIGGDDLPHASCKGIVFLDAENDLVYLFDLYRGQTYVNLKRNPAVALTAVEEHKFRGWCLKGRAKIVSEEKIHRQFLKYWDEKVASRITQRILRNLREEKGHPKHPEALFPAPNYLVAVKIKKTVDLTPRHLRGG